MRSKDARGVGKKYLKPHLLDEHLNKCVEIPVNTTKLLNYVCSYVADLEKAAGWSDRISFRFGLFRSIFREVLAAKGS